MDLFKFLRVGGSHAALLADRAAASRQATIDRAAEKTRAQWLGVLTIDATRAWMSVGEKDRDVLTGLVIMLTIAGFCHAHAGGTAEHPDLRVFRGAVSAATQCSAAGSIITVEHARAFHSAVTRAQDVIRAASVPAILHAAASIRFAVDVSDLSAPGVRAGAGVLVAAL